MTAGRRAAAAPKNAPHIAARSKPPTLERTPTTSSLSGRFTSIAVRMTAFFLRKLSSVIPPPRPVTASTSAPSSTASTAEEVVVLPMPISPTPITSASTVLAISAPVRMACKVCSRVIAGPVQIFCVP